MKTNVSVVLRTFNSFSGTKNGHNHYNNYAKHTQIKNVTRITWVAFCQYRLGSQFWDWNERMKNWNKRQMWKTNANDKCEPVYAIRVVYIWLTFNFKCYINQKLVPKRFMTRVTMRRCEVRLAVMSGRETLMNWHVKKLGTFHQQAKDRNGCISSEDRNLHVQVSNPTI